MRSETQRLQHEQSVMKEKIRDNGEKIKQNKVLPYLVGNVVEVSIAHHKLMCAPLISAPRFWMSTLKARRTAQIRI
jgi:ATP-dependent 26S proteasome regulatory subunit